MHIIVTVCYVLRQNIPSYYNIRVEVCAAKFHLAVLRLKPSHILSGVSCMWTFHRAEMKVFLFRSHFHIIIAIVMEYTMIDLFSTYSAILTLLKVQVIVVSL